MKFFAALATLASIASASGLVARADSVDVNTVLDDISNIKNQTAGLTTTVNNFSGRGSEAIGLQGVISDLKDVIYQAVDDINQLSPLNEADSTKLASAVLGLTPTVQASLDATVKKQAEFNEALPGVVNGIVGGDLTELKEGTDALGAAIAAKLSATYAKIAPQVQGQIDGYFTSAIHVFATASNAPGGEPTGNAAPRGQNKQFDPYAFGPAVLAVGAALAL